MNHTGLFPIPFFEGSAKIRQKYFAANFFKEDF
jgi:hypothetical protein